MTSAWTPLMNRSYSTSMAATSASSSSFPSTTSPSSKKASRCAGVRSAARAAATAHASHDRARRIIPRALRVTLAACGDWLVVCSSGAARATDAFCGTRPLIRR